MEKKTVVICTQNQFPNHDAGANYFYNFASIFDLNQYNVIFIGNSKIERKIDIKYDGIEYISIKIFRGKSIVGRIFNHLFDKKRQIHLLFKYIKNPSFVFLDSTFSKKQYDRVIDHYSKLSTNCKFGIFVLEKYSIDENEKDNFYLRKIIRNNNYLVHNYSNTKYRIFAISSFLRNCFESRLFLTMTLPYVFSSDISKEYGVTTSEHTSLNILYSGIPSNKDDLEIIFKALVSLKDPNIKFNVIGVTDNWLKRRNKSLFDAVKPFVNFYGHKDADFILDMYSKSDFSILVRNPDKVFVKAGFPTKVSQSLACGVPVISNLTSDLGLYLNENNSIIIESYEVNSIVDAIQKAVKMSKDVLDLMKINARKTSLEKLEISKFKEEIFKFLEE